jgi:hypothetical protein
MNFLKSYAEGQAGKKFGLPTGLDDFDNAINGIQKKSIYGIGAAPKVGKSSFVLHSFLIYPFMYAQKHGLNIHWKFFSFEMDRIKIEFKIAAFFFWYDYGLDSFEFRGDTYEINANYLEGKLKKKSDDPLAPPEIIKLTEEHERILYEIYKKRIIPIMGEYNEEGEKIKEGVVDFIEDAENPTGINKYLRNYAEENGSTVFQEYQTRDERGNKVTRKRAIGYNPHDPELHTIVIIDHLRKMKLERQFTIKQNIDKMLEYQVKQRNLYGFTFVDIIHLNRSIGETNRIKYHGNTLYPTGDDVKDTGNLSEDADFLITLFNPLDEKYKLKKHFNIDLNKYPNYRSIHLVESRDTPCPTHIRANFYGNVCRFEPIKL